MTDKEKVWLIYPNVYITFDSCMYNLRDKDTNKILGWTHDLDNDLENIYSIVWHNIQLELEKRLSQ
jgi:hypothetical protein